MYYRVEAVEGLLFKVCFKHDEGSGFKNTWIEGLGPGVQGGSENRFDSNPLRMDQGQKLHHPPKPTQIKLMASKLFTLNPKPDAPKP